jgi:transcription initiation factor TFIIIB Brf1 subunit/transcription initiation factor TFIIB
MSAVDVHDRGAITVPDESRCSSCGGRIRGTDTEVYCESCGLVTDSQPLDDIHPTAASAPITRLARIGAVGPGNHDASGTATPHLHRLRLVALRQSDRRTEKLRRLSVEIRRVVNALSLPNAVAEAGEDYGRKIVEGSPRWKWGTYDASFCAVMAAMRHLGIHVTFEELCSRGGYPRGEVRLLITRWKYANRCYHFGLPRPSAPDLMWRGIQTGKVPRSLGEEAMRLAKAVDERFGWKGSPTVLAATVLWVASKGTISQRKAVELLGGNIVSLRHWRESVEDLAKDSGASS